jgi:hypothetical protein
MRRFPKVVNGNCRGIELRDKGFCDSVRERDPPGQGEGGLGAGKERKADCEGRFAMVIVFELEPDVAGLRLIDG